LKICKDCHKKLPLTEFFVSKKSGVYNNCKSCLKLLRRVNRIKNKAKIDHKVKEYKLAHLEEITKYQNQYYIDNHAELRAKGNQYSRENREILNKAQRKWAKLHPDKKLAAVRKRQAAKLNRTPKWLTKEDFEKIEEFYFYAKLFSETLGELYEVDHIIPLRGKNISGLHIPSNLQILTEKEHRKKGTKFPYIKGI